MTKDFSHLDAQGRAEMVDVSGKSETKRRALAEVRVVLGKDCASKLLRRELPKGEALAVARIAGIQGGKRTSSLLPLCHPLPLSKISVDFDWFKGDRGVRCEDDGEEQAGAPDTLRIRAEAWCTGKTGVEMEALTACSVAALCIYDMCKAVEKGIRIEGLRLLEKDGGKSGAWRSGEAEA